jgi:hypothetical protein
MKSHNGFLPNGVFRVGKEVNNKRQNGRDGFLIDEAANGVESCANDEVVIGLKILLNCINDEDDEVVIVV